MLESTAMLNDLILLNGNIRTLDAQQPRASALVLRAGEIVYVGDEAGAREFQNHATEILDAHGRLVLPGLTDAHIHFCGYAQTLTRVNLTGCHSLEEAVARIAARVSTARPGEPIAGFGWNHMDWANPVFPDKRPLDQVAPNNPVLLMRKDAHSAWVNSAALRQAGITRETPDPEGGKLERDAQSEPTGLVRENAMELFGKGIGQDDEEIPPETLQRAIAQAHRAGITAIHNVEGPNALRAWQLLHEQGRLKLRVVHSIPYSLLDHARALGLRRGLGDQWLVLQAVKMFADGSLGSQTAEMRQPYVGSDKRGMAVAGAETMLELARTAVQNGIDVWIHAIGDAAITRVLDIYATLRGEGYSDAIFRIEHAQHLDPGDLPRFSQLNVIASMQPIHQPNDMQMADALLGPERARYTYAFNSLRKAGALLAFGSDCPVERFDPLRGICAAVTRQNDSGHPQAGWYPEQRISVQAAVEGFTLGAALAAGDGKRAGTLSVGKRADLVILSQDIFDIAPQEILQTQIDCTIVGGEIVFCREGRVQ